VLFLDRTGAQDQQWNGPVRINELASHGNVRNICLLVSPHVSGNTKLWNSCEMWYQCVFLGGDIVLQMAGHCAVEGRTLAAGTAPFFASIPISLSASKRKPSSATNLNGWMFLVHIVTTAFTISDFAVGGTNVSFFCEKPGILNSVWRRVFVPHEWHDWLWAFSPRVPSRDRHFITWWHFLHFTDLLVLLSTWKHTNCFHTSLYTFPLFGSNVTLPLLTCINFHISFLSILVRKLWLQHAEWTLVPGGHFQKRWLADMWPLGDMSACLGIG